MEPGDRRLACGPSRERREQPDPYPRADEPAYCVWLLAFASDGGLDAGPCEELVGEGSLPVAAAGGDEGFAGEILDLDTSAVGKAV